MACVHGTPFAGINDIPGRQAPTTVFGFASQSHSTPFSPPRQSSAQRARSLLSDMLQNMDNMHYSSTDEDDEGYSSGGTSADEEEELSVDELSLCDSSSTCSMPIAIPNHTYFKGEDQKDALKKLTAKRKWWSQQQHIGSHAEKAQPAQMAAQKQAVSHHKYHKQTHYARGNQTRQA